MGGWSDEIPHIVFNTEFRDTEGVMGRFPHLMLLSVFPGLLVSEKREKKKKQREMERLVERFHINVGGPQLCTCG